MGNFEKTLPRFASDLPSPTKPREWRSGTFLKPNANDDFNAGMLCIKTYGWRAKRYKRQRSQLPEISGSLVVSIITAVSTATLAVHYHTYSIIAKPSLPSSFMHKLHTSCVIIGSNLCTT